MYIHITKSHVDQNGCLHLDIPVGTDLAGQDLEIQVSYRSLSSRPSQSDSDAQLNTGELKMKAIQEICDQIKVLPRLDDRSAEEIIGYNSMGLLE